VAGIGLLVLGAMLAFWMKPDEGFDEDPSATLVLHPAST